MNDEERRVSGRLFDSGKLHDRKWMSGKAFLDEYNNRGFGTRGDEESLADVFASYGEGSMIIPPFYYSQGKNVHIGSHFFANAWLMILDEADIYIGDNVFVGPNVSIYTPVHPYDAKIRNTGLKIALPVTIEDNVWIGGSVTILPGVTIGEGSIIGAGSVVTKDIGPGVVAAGNPCRVIRSLGDADREKWEAMYEDYMAEEAQAKGKTEP